MCISPLIVKNHTYPYLLKHVWKIVSQLNLVSLYFTKMIYSPFPYCMKLTQNLDYMVLHGISSVMADLLGSVTPQLGQEVAQPVASSWRVPSVHQGHTPHLCRAGDTIQSSAHCKAGCRSPRSWAFPSLVEGVSLPTWKILFTFINTCRFSTGSRLLF